MDSSKRESIQILQFEGESLNLYPFRPDDLAIDVPHFRFQESWAKNADSRDIRLHEGLLGARYLAVS
jgi:hypothetical protein